jgi:uncharacterized membrane protein (UPF0182 family)
MYIWELISIGVASFFLALQPNKEQIKGKFLNNIFSKAIPAGIAAVSMVVILFALYFLGKEKMLYTGLNFNEVIVDGKIVDIALRQTISISVLCFSLFSFVCLFRIILPANKYRLIVYFGMIVLLIGLLTIDVLWNIKTRDLVGGPTNILKIDYQYLNKNNYVIGLIVLVIVSTIYAISNYIVSTIKRKEVVTDDNNQ